MNQQNYQKKNARMERDLKSEVVLALAGKSIYISGTILVFAVVLYVTFTGITVWNTNERADNETAITTLQSGVGALEVKLADLHGNISEKLAYVRGFQESNSVKYISAKSPSVVARLNETDL